jgi:hypothetical protein
MVISFERILAQNKSRMRRGRFQTRHRIPLIRLLPTSADPK